MYKSMDDRELYKVITLRLKREQRREYTLGRRRTNYGVSRERRGSYSN